jgi:hypothetical protein
MALQLESFWNDLFRKHQRTKVLGFAIPMNFVWPGGDEPRPYIFLVMNAFHHQHDSSFCLTLLPFAFCLLNRCARIGFINVNNRVEILE